MDAVGDPHPQQRQRRRQPSNNNNRQNRNSDDDNHSTIQQDGENDMFVASTIADAARSIRHGSFAIYKVPSHTAQAIRVAWTEARNFFATTTSTTLPTSTTSSVATIDASTVVTTGTGTGTAVATETTAKSGGSNISQRYIIHQGQLHGFYEPSAAKYLYRTFCNSPHQPWPACNDSNKSNIENGEYHPFRQASIQVAQELHQLLMACLAQIQQQQERQHQHQTYDPEPCHHGGGGGGGGGGGEDDESSSPKRKRRRSEFQPQTTESQSSPITVPTHALDPVAQCPLDYFLYHGQQERRQHQHQAASHQPHGNITTTATGNPSSITTPTNPAVVVPNCTAHVDRGLLIVVCLTNVPGLEVWSRRRHGGSFQCPEILSHHATLYREIEPCAGGEYVCIMAGDQLSDYCQQTPTMEDGAQRRQLRRRLDACVHRVRNNLPQARLSISYELRGVQRQTHSAG